MGLVILTGCTKAGIVDVVARARSVMPKDVHLLLGGFLLEEQSEASISPIVRGLREKGVKNLGVTHCTGDRAFDLLKKGFGRNFVPLGAGKTIFIR